MKYVAALLMICLISIASTAIWAQNGPGDPQNRRQNDRTDCMKYNANLPVQPLSPEEESWLLYMREEEKLARDVYSVFFDQYRLRIFNNIAASEQRHFNALGSLIDSYGLTDPAQAVPGLFTNEDLQETYYSLIDEGMKSLLSALQVGVIIEEQDISDLQEAMSQTNKRDLLRVYSNLLNGSMNHLDAFESHIEVAVGN